MSLHLHPTPATEPLPVWQIQIDAALAAVADHPDIERLRRIRDVLTEARASIQRISDECEDVAIREAVDERLFGVLASLDDVAAPLICALDEWDEQREERAAESRRYWHSMRAAE
jgi:hypothetical protein